MSLPKAKIWPVLRAIGRVHSVNALRSFPAVVFVVNLCQTAGLLQIIKAVSTAFREQESINMAEVIQNNLIEEGIKIGVALGSKRGLEIGREKTRNEIKIDVKSELILTALAMRFRHVRSNVIEKIIQTTDISDLDWYFHLAITCDSVETFAKNLK